MIEGIVNFAVIGAGRIGRRHATMVVKNEYSKLVALTDIDTSVHEELRQEFGVPVYTTHQEMFKNHPEIHVVNVCSPNGEHAKQSIDALDANFHVVCEKPMALTKQDAEEVLFRALKRNKLVFCVMQNRYSPPAQWLKSVVDDGILGEIYMVQINCYWNRDDDYYKGGDPNYWKGKLASDGGTLFTQFSHFIDTMFWLFGDIKNINAKFYDFNHQKTTEFEDSGIIHFDFVKQGAGSINYSTAVWNNNLESSITIIGQKGSIKVGGQYMNEVEVCNIEGYEMPKLEETLPANDYGKYKGSAANHHFVIDNVVETLKGRNFVSTNSLEGLKVVEIIENIYRLKS
ncbi:Gfo/Idh/MocA family protein [Acidiluteibacter ferrifornacis]|uniref:Gfo/Idh/MocA family protein n=1 Tax=Acidiluteibacter ferrifornacis TaxID=2692424 RepID=UPI001A962BD1|nr:Gfo/Idh/MocA family oxidoreductase [Acidiluteibacter ferrifornacis]